MSVEAFSWALTVPIGGNAKICLLGLANHAHPDGTEAYPALDTLASYGCCDRSTVRRNVRKLVDEGWAIEDGLGPKGQTKYRLPLWRDDHRPKGPPKPRGSKTPPVASEAPGGGDQGTLGVALMPPEPSKEPSLEPSTSQNASTGRRAAADSVPDDFPDELRPHARQAMRVLRDAASRQRNAKAVTARALALVIQARPRKPIVRAAHDYAAWLDGKQRRDLVAGYRNWLDGTDDLAALEALPGEGPPVSAAGSNVTRLHDRRGDRRAERDRMDAEEAAAMSRLRGDA